MIVSPCSDQDKSFFAELLARQIGWQLLPCGQKDDGRIEATRTDTLEQLAAPSGAEARSNFGKLAAKLAHRFCKGEFGEGVRNSNPNLSHRKVTVGRRSMHFPNFVEQSPASFQCSLAGTG
jgi:hypothetical protein